MADALWYHMAGGRQTGPIDEAAMTELVRSGRLPPGTPVWKTGMAGWQAWELVTELAAVAPPRAAAPPPPAFGAPPPPGWGAPAGGAGPRLSGNSYAADVLAGGPAPAPLYPKAPLGSRFLAAVVDSLLFAAPAAILLGIAGASRAADVKVLAVVFGFLGGVAMLWALWYAFTKDGRPNGQSIGKRWMGLMVVHLATNRPCTTGQSALRYLVWFLLNLIPYVGWLVEPVVTLVAAGGRRLGDNAAGTQVIAVADYRPQR